MRDDPIDDRIHLSRCEPRHRADIRKIVEADLVDCIVAMPAQLFYTTGIPAEIGHAAGGAYNLTTKSGTNQLHFSAEERYINKDWLHRQIFNQGATNTPFEYHNFNSTLSGPIVIPKLYDGKNKTFFFLGYRLDYDHETNYATVSVPTQAELNGNFSFNGVGLPVYDPKTITCAAASGCANGTGYTATAFPGNVIPLSRIDPVVQKFFSLNPYNLPNLPVSYINTGPVNDFISGIITFPTVKVTSERSISSSARTRKCSCATYGINIALSADATIFYSTGKISTTPNTLSACPSRWMSGISLSVTSGPLVPL